MSKDPTPVVPRRQPSAIPFRTLRAAARDLRKGGGTAIALKASGRARRAVQVARYHWSPRRLVRSPESVPIDRPVFILGVQGGGVTILARCLYRHPKVVYATGNWRWWAGEDEIHNCAHVVPDLPEAMVHRSYHFGNVDASTPDHPKFGFQRAWLYAVDELLPEYQRSEKDVTPTSTAQLRRVIQKIVLAYADDPDDCRFVDMSQLYTVQVPYVARLLEGCDPRFILAVRNPYATCARAVAKEYTADRGSHIEEDLALRVRCAVEHWSNSYRIALEASHKVPMLRLRYENFLERPKHVIKQICEFADLPFDARMVPGPNQSMPVGSLDHEKWYPLKLAENDRYLKNLPTGLVELLNDRAGDIIDELGYERLEAN